MHIITLYRQTSESLKSVQLHAFSLSENKLSFFFSYHCCAMQLNFWSLCETTTCTSGSLTTTSILLSPKIKRCFDYFQRHFDGIFADCGFLTRLAVALLPSFFSSFLLDDNENKSTVVIARKNGHFHFDNV